MPEGQTAGEQNFELIKGTNLFKVGQLNNTRDFAQMDSIQPLSDVLGKLSGELNDYAGAYPGLTKALAGAETAIKAMTAAAWAFAGIKFLSSAGAAATASGSAAAGAGAASRIPGWAGRLGLVGGRVLAPFALWQGAEAAPLMQVGRGDAEARARLEKGNYPNDQARMLDALKSRPGLMDAWDEVKAWWASPSSISIPQSANGYPVPPFAQQPAQQTQSTSPPSCRSMAGYWQRSLTRQTVSRPRVGHREDRTDGMGNGSAGRQLPGRRVRYHYRP